MAQDVPRYVQVVQQCEAAITRIRAAIRAGAGDSEAVGEDLAFIQNVVQPGLIRYARSLHWLGEQAFEEALLAMQDRLVEDIWSLTFASLETGFGKYLQHMPLRIVQKTARNYRVLGVSAIIEHLDESLGDDGLQLHETIEDQTAQLPFRVIGEQEEMQAAIQRLPGPERQVISLRLQNIDNNEIARRLGVSPATATRICQRAVAMLKRWLNPAEE